MNNLLKAESYKLLHNKSFWGLFLFSFVLGSIMLFDSNRLTDDMLDASLYNIPLMYFLIIIFAVPFIGEDFGNRTIHSFVSGGHKRMDVLLAKTVIYLSASEGILVGPLLFHSFIGIVMGSVEVVAVTEFLEKIGLILIAVLAMGMLPLSVAFVFKDIGRTLAIPMALFFLMIFALNSDYSSQFAVLLPMGQLRLLSLNELWVSKIMILGIDVLWIFLLYIISYIGLRHCDLK